MADNVMSLTGKDGDAGVETSKEMLQLTAALEASRAR